MKLEITKEKVLEAASKCSTAKETLKTLFPDVFDNEICVVATHLNRGSMGEEVVIHDAIGYGSPHWLVAVSHNQKSRIELSDEYYWRIEGHLLIPTKK